MPWSMILGCVAAAVAAGFVIFALMPKRGSEAEAIDRRLEADDAGAVKNTAGSRSQRASQAQLMTAFKKAAPKLAAPISEEDQSRLRAKLSAAGFRSESGPAVFLASKSLLGLVAAGVTLLLTWSAHQTGTNIVVLTVFVGAICFMLPDLYLAQVAGQRSIKIKKALADCLDMMVIMVESGLGMDGAIQRIGTEMAEPYPELSEEFRIATAEMNMGLPRSEALENLARRTGVREIQSLVATIVQAERFGSSVGKTLRVQSDTLRTKRQQAAEEAAGKTAVKLLIPLILFIFPALMIVVGAPAAITLLNTSID